MEQERLWHDDIFDATRTAIQRLGGFKTVGAALWPEKSPDKAGELLANCLNRTRPEKLDLEQFLLIVREARKVGCHVVAAFICDNAGYAPPQPIEPKDEMAELQRAYISAVEAQRALIERMERVQTRLK